MISQSIRFTHRKLYFLVALLGVGAALMVLTLKGTVSGSTVIDFEGFSPETTITTQYGEQGVLFRFAYLDTDPQARSGTRVLRSGDPGDEFDLGPMVIDFTSGQTRVSLFAGTTLSVAPVNGTLRAYDGGGGLVDQDGPKLVAPRVFTTAFQVSTTEPVIQRVELEIESTEFEAIDDLEFEGDTPPPPPTEPPIVEISSPSDGAELDISDITVNGTVTGPGLFPNAILTLEIGRPPDSMAPPLTASMPLVGSGTARNFSLDLLLGIGPHMLTVEAENTGNFKGSDTVSFINLPEAIRLRFAADGGAATFGALRYGGAEGPCRMAVYDLGAISFDTNGNTTHVVLGDIFDKWFSLRDQGAALARPGCPTSEERVVLGGARAQDFTRGRIYADLPTGAHFVPAVFVDAIDQLGGETGIGVPIMDPTDSSGVMQAWLFQRFTRPDAPQLLPSTLEIRGSSPTLWVERQGGDLSDLFFEGIPRSPTLPTIWQQFPCSGLLGPCQVSPPTSLPPLQDAGNRFCDGDTYPFGPAEWEPVLGDHVLTTMLGIVNRSHKAGVDNPLVHEYHEGPLSFASDWNVHVNPLHPFRNLFGNNTDDIEVEFEGYFARVFFAQFDWPLEGDLYFVGGRWIIDCGHESYNSEIHPPFVAAHMRTETHNGHPATQANIWVNGYYTGDPVSIDIFPPPRPSPDALLNITKPVDDEAALGVNVQFATPASSQARVDFTASPRQVEVTGAGEMIWEAGRAYYGRWHVYWTE